MRTACSVAVSDVHQVDCTAMLTALLALLVPRFVGLVPLSNESLAVIHAEGLSSHIVQGTVLDDDGETILAFSRQPVC